MRKIVRQLGSHNSMRKIVRQLGIVMFVCALHVHAVAEYDIVISGGTVIDPETGLQAVRDVGIEDGTITAVSRESLSGSTMIDAEGLIVAPGFIDLHAHGQDLDNSRFQVMDGVTTACEMEIGVSDVDEYYRERVGDSLNNFGATIGLTRIRIDMTDDPGDSSPVQRPFGPSSLLDRRCKRPSRRRRRAPESDGSVVFLLVASSNREPPEHVLLEPLAEAYTSCEILSWENWPPQLLPISRSHRFPSGPLVI